MLFRRRLLNQDYRPFAGELRLGFPASEKQPRTRFCPRRGLAASVEDAGFVLWTSWLQGRAFAFSPFTAAITQLLCKPVS